MIKQRMLKAFVFLAMFICLGFLPSCMPGSPSEEEYTSPSAPSGLNLKLGSIHLSWTDNSNNEVGFIIERKINAQGTWQEAGRVGAGVIEYVDNFNFSEDVPVFYRVCAYNNQGKSAYSNISFVNSTLWVGFQDVKVSGNYAYCLNTNGLVIFDVSNPNHPVKLSSLALGITGSAGTLVTYQRILVGPGPYVYVPYGEDGIKIVDVSNASNPALVSTFHTTGYAESVFIETRGAKIYAYISEYWLEETGFAGLEVADFTDARNPTFVARNDFGAHGFIGSSFVKYPYAYVVDGAGFKVFDVSNLPNLLEVGKYEDHATTNAYLGITVKNNLAYVSYLPHNLAGNFGFDIVDISNHASPTYLNSWGVTMANDSRMPSIIADDLLDIVYVVDNDILAIDVSDPDHLTNAWRITLRNDANIMSRAGDLIFAAEEQGLEIYKLTFDAGPPIDPTDFEYLGSSYTSSYVADLEIQNRTELGKKFAFVATHTTGLKVVDITDENSPNIVYEMPQASQKRLSQVLIKNNFLYSTSIDAADIFDISIPADPVLLSSYSISRSYDFPTWYYGDGIAITGNYMLVCQSGGSANFIDILNISDPAHPARVKTYSVNSAPMTIFIDGQYGYIGEADGLEIIDVTNVNNITRVSKTADHNVSQVLATGNRAYYTNTTSFVIADVTNKAAPHVLGSYAMPAQHESTGASFMPYKFFVEGNNVYVTTWLNEIIKLDISSPSSITKTDVIRTPGIPLNLLVDNGTFYIADMYSLLIIK